MNDPLAPLRDKFRARAADDLARLRVLVLGDLNDDALKLLVHNLAGAAGLFGYPALGEAAMQIDDRFATGETPGADQLTLLEQRLRDVIA